MATLMRKATLVCCSEIADPQWRWLETSLADTGLKFEFARCVPRNALEKIRRFNLARLRGSFEAVLLARRTRAKALVTHGPTLAAWCALFTRLFGLRIPIIAHSFNFTVLPSPAKRLVFTFALSRIERFVVFSTIERDLYAKTFRLPADRFDIVHWGVRPPEVDTPETPLEQGSYVSAIGGNARDYPTLIEAARRLPDVRFVLVVRPHNLRGLNLPPNVAVYTNLPHGKTMNVLLHSRFTVLPLVNSEVPCGHVTLVAAMHLGKALVITDSAGVHDYVRDGDNALAVTACSVESLVAATRRLWENRALCARLGENGRRFASLQCTEERIADHFRHWLQSHQLEATARDSR
jgi:glycosyltransferase involved in cell wall biosynthesis